MDGVDEFTHNVAIKISRVMNTLNPNDLLARRVIDIAKNNSADGFIKAASGFGLTQTTFLKELHTEILDHLKQEKLGHHVAPVQGITVHDTDVLEPEPARKGGLVRPDTVRIFDSYIYPIRLFKPLQQHTFRTPAKPLPPPTPRRSVLGLDKLAQEKRSAAEAALSDDRNRKRPRSDGQEPQFKGVFYKILTPHYVLTNFFSSWLTRISKREHSSKTRADAVTSGRSVRRRQPPSCRIS